MARTSFPEFLKDLYQILQTNNGAEYIHDVDDDQLAWAEGWSAHERAELIMGGQLPVPAATLDEVDAIKNKWVNDPDRDEWDTYSGRKFEPYQDELKAFQQLTIQKLRLVDRCLSFKNDPNQSSSLWDEMLKQSRDYLDLMKKNAMLVDACLYVINELDETIPGLDGTWLSIIQVSRKKISSALNNAHEQSIN